MKKLLLVIVVCVPLYLIAQGFGSFSHDQPFLAKDFISGSSTNPFSNAQYWYTASNGPANINGASTNSGTVTSWSNLGLRGGSVDAAGVASWYSNTAVNGHAGVFFPNSGSARLDSSTIPNTYQPLWLQPTTAIWVGRLPSAGSYEFWDTYVYFGGVGLGGQHSYDSDGSGNISAYAGANITANFSSVIGKVMVISAVYNYTNSYLRLNGALVASGNDGTNCFGPPNIGGSFLTGTANMPIGSFMSELIIWSRELNTNELQFVENSFISTYGTNTWP